MKLIFYNMFDFSIDNEVYGQGSQVLATLEVERNTFSYKLRPSG